MDLPQAPRLIFGVFDRWHRDATPDRDLGEYKVGWKIEPKYGYLTRFSEDRVKMENALPDEYTRWLAARKSHIIRNMTLAHALSHRTILSVDCNREDYGYITIYLDRDDTITVIRTKGEWHGISCEQPETYGAVKRVLSDGKTIRFENGQALKFSNKVGLYRLSDSFVERLYA